MKRRIDWKLGDSAPDFSNIILNVYGNGEIQIETGFSTSSVQVSFSRTYLQRVIDTYGNKFDLEILVDSVNDSGFVLKYKNIPEDIPLEINYIAL